MIAALRAMDDQNENTELHIAERMAEIIAKRIHQHGQCSILDVRAMGFSIDDIERYWSEACKLAETKRPRAGL